MSRHVSRRHPRAALVGLALAGVIVTGAPQAPLRAEPRPSASETARLERELRELHTQLSDVQRAEQEHFEAVRRLLQKDGSAAPVEAKKGAAGPTAVTAEPTTALPVAPPPAPLVLTSVTGHVTSKIPLRDVYVYLEGFRSNAGRKATIEIVQTHKSFEPAFTVALAGTRATFPNRDTFFHNVFSPTPVPFDLGTYRADETSPAVPLNTPGVVDVFCNIHAQMHAQILVVPNRVYTRVADDGSFRLDKVPAGRRKLVAWGPGMRPTRIDVNVPTTGTSVKFDLDIESPVRHKNKFGLPYGAYKE